MFKIMTHFFSLNNYLNFTYSKVEINTEYFSEDLVNTSDHLVKNELITLKRIGTSRFSNKFLIEFWCT